MFRFLSGEGLLIQEDGSFSISTLTSEARGLLERLWTRADHDSGETKEPNAKDLMSKVSSLNHKINFTWTCEQHPLQQHQIIILYSQFPSKMSNSWKETDEVYLKHLHRTATYSIVKLGKNGLWNSLYVRITLHFFSSIQRSYPKKWTKAEIKHFIATHKSRGFNKVYVKRNTCF